MKTSSNYLSAMSFVGLAMAVAFAGIAHGEKSDEARSPFVGMWELTSTWEKEDLKGKQIVTVNADLTEQPITGSLNPGASDAGNRSPRHGAESVCCRILAWGAGTVGAFCGWGGRHRRILAPHGYALCTCTIGRSCSK